jgi:hypothetical protein
LSGVGVMVSFPKKIFKTSVSGPFWTVAVYAV